MEEFNLFFQKHFFSNTILDYIYFLGLFFVLFSLFVIVRKFGVIKIKALASKTKIDLDDLMVEILDNISSYFFWFLSFYLAVKILILPEFLSRVIYYIFVILLLWEIIAIAKIFIHYLFEKLSAKGDSKKKAVYLIFEKIIAVAIYIISFLILLSVFGIDITAIVAGLGVGGIAIAFALKEILADLFSYVTILLDKPIKKGDFIEVEGKEGSVKEIGIKTTRLTGIDGREVVVSNSFISSGLLENSGKREYRRVKFVLGIAYDTPLEKLKKIKPTIEEIVSQEEKGEFLRSHFKNFGDSALEFSVDYKLFIKEYDEYADARERINFAILEFCEKEGIEIAYPTMTIHQK